MTLTRCLLKLTESDNIKSEPECRQTESRVGIQETPGWNIEWGKRKPLRALQMCGGNPEEEDEEEGY